MREGVELYAYIGAQRKYIKYKLDIVRTFVLFFNKFIQSMDIQITSFMRLYLFKR